MNFYKINSEVLIDEIMNENKFSLICILFSTDNESNFPKDVINNTRIIKKGIKTSLSDKYKDVIFLYVNLSNYIIADNKYSKYISKSSIPYVGFYFNNNQLASISLANLEVLESGIIQLKEKIEKIVFENKEQNKEENNQDLENDLEENNHNTNNVKENIEEVNQKNLLIQKQQIREELVRRKKLEEIEKLKQQYFINELTRIKKAKELEEQNEN